jgi:SAM-dependent methyltransferase
LEIGCQQSEAILKTANAEGKIHRGNIFSPPLTLIGNFDYVVSMGLVEHFSETDKALGACAQFLKPGGRVVTTVPNMLGLPGFLQKSLNKENYNILVPISAEQLKLANEKAGLKVESYGYLLFNNFGSLSTENNRIASWIRKPLIGFSVFTWIIERLGINLPANRFTSPYVYCIATKQ